MRGSTTAILWVLAGVPAMLAFTPLMAKIGLFPGLLGFGAPLAVAQWVVLWGAEAPVSARRWVGLTILGGAVGGGLGLLFALVVFTVVQHGLGMPEAQLNALVGPPVLVAMLALVGLGIGLAQRLHLRRVSHRAGWWVAANAAGGALLGVCGMLVVATMLSGMRFGEDPRAFLLTSLTGVAYQVATAPLLPGLLREWRAKAEAADADGASGEGAVAEGQ